VAGGHDADAEVVLDREQDGLGHIRFRPSFNPWVNLMNLKIVSPKNSIFNSKFYLLNITLV
jgi:hypothetical protein